MDIILSPDEKYDHYVKARPLIHAAKVFKVSEGRAPLEGMRIRYAYIDIHCYQNPYYEECIYQIQQCIHMTTREGKIFLI